MNPTFEQLRVPRLGGTRALLEHHGISRRGVVHVGGHRGEELELYLGCGFQRILYLEPNPEVYAGLEQHLSYWRDWLAVLQEAYGLQTQPELESLCLAAGDCEAQELFHLTRCSGQSSLLAPAPELEAQAQIEVAVRPLDGLLAERAPQFSVLTIDAQGAELLVLRGAEKLLQSLEMVVVEVNFRPRYQGGPGVAQVEAFMEAAGYRAVVRSQASPWAHGGDIAYVRAHK